MHRANAAEIFDLSPLGPRLKDARTTAIVKSETFEAVRLNVLTGVDIKTHKVEGPITLHCLEGRAQLSLSDTVMELSGGQWLYLEGGVPHSIKGIEDTFCSRSYFRMAPYKKSRRGTNWRGAEASDGWKSLECRQAEFVARRGLLPCFCADKWREHGNAMTKTNELLSALQTRFLGVAYSSGSRFRATLAYCLVRASSVAGHGQRQHRPPARSHSKFIAMTRTAKKIRASTRSRSTSTPVDRWFWMH